MSGRLTMTPWARNAVLAAGLQRSEVRDRIPDGWDVDGHARSARAGFTFEGRHRATGHTELVVAQGWTDVAPALERLYAAMEVEA